MNPDEKWRNEDVIDAAQWLEKRVERHIEAGRHDEAIRYLRRLSLKVDGEQQRQCALFLGYLYLVEGDADRSRRWLLKAEQMAPTDPHLMYALGHVAVAHDAYARATLRFLEAFAGADDPHDEAEFLRSAALSMMQNLGPVAPVAAMLLGALDRDLGNPWILDALARVYEADQRWMESLETLSLLAKVVRDATDSVVVHRTPRTRQLLRNRLMGKPARPEELERRARAINEAVREQFEVVLDERHHRGPTELAPLQFPPALRRLVRILEWRDRGVELVEAAQGVWAQATGEGFDEMLGTERLAAAIQVLVERLHWRVPSPLSEVARFHGAARGAISPAARVIAGRLGLELFDEMALKASLEFHEGRRFDQLNRALLFGETLDDVQERIRLGG